MTAFRSSAVSASNAAFFSCRVLAILRLSEAPAALSFLELALTDSLFSYMVRTGLHLL